MTEQRRDLAIGLTIIAFVALVTVLVSCGGGTGPSTTTTTVPRTDEGIPGRVYEIELPSGGRCAIWYTGTEAGGIDCDWSER